MEDAVCVSTVAADSKAPEKTRAFFALAISPSCKVPAEPNLLALLRQHRTVHRSSAP